MSISIAILVSGRGSNMKAILEAIEQGRLDAHVPIVLSNNADAPALATARQFGVTAKAIPHRGLSRQEHEAALLAELKQHKIDFVVLAGYMRVLTPHFLNAFRDEERGIFRVINIHPSLLPAFAGAHAYEEAFAYGVRVSGITVHFVDEHVDHGPILAQETFARLESDTLDTFKARGLEVEHRIYPAVLQSLACTGINLVGEQIRKPIPAAQAGGRSSST